MTAGGLLLDQLTVWCEFHFYFNLLKTAIVSYQSFADKIDGTVTFIVKTEVVVQVHAAFDDFANYRLTHETFYQIPLANPAWKLRLGVSNDYNSTPPAGAQGGSVGNYAMSGRVLAEVLQACA